MIMTNEILYLLLLYAVLMDGKLDVTKTLLIAFGIILLAPCLRNLCAPRRRACGGDGFDGFREVNGLF